MALNGKRCRRALFDCFLEFMMTYRVYVRWPGQRVTKKTITASKAIADTAWHDLKRMVWPGKHKPIGLAYSLNGAQVDYVDLSDSVSHL
jgi:hypothetical protein